jgi:hypothetical protein
MRADMAINSKPNPYVLGFSIGVGLGLAILISVLWFPWLWDEKYKQLRDFLLMQRDLPRRLVRRYWTVSRVPRFWLALLIFAVVHSVGF